MACWRGRPSSPAGSARKSAKPNHRVSSLRGSWRSRHQWHSGSAQTWSRNRRTSRPRLRELMAHPGRHHGIAAGHRQPRQSVGQLPGMLFHVFHRGCGLRPARRSGEKPFNGPKGLGVGRPGRTAHVREEVVEARSVAHAGQPVPGGEQVRVHFAESPLLVGEDLQNQPGIQLGIVAASPPQRPVLVVLDQVVIGVAGKGQGVEAQRVHRGQPQQPQVGIRGPQVGQVEVDEVVVQQEVRAVVQVVQSGQRLGQAAAGAGDGHALIRIRPHAGQGVDPVVRPADFQVQGQAAQQCAVTPFMEGIAFWPVVDIRVRHLGDCSERKLPRPFDHSDHGIGPRRRSCRGRAIARDPSNQHKGASANENVPTGISVRPPQKPQTAC